MNIVILLTSMVASLGLGSLHQLLMRYFPYLPTEFDSTTTPRDQYDFVVVGAGCGGSVVASRLSETSASVLLLEAGGSAQPETASPLLTMLNFFRYTEWNYEIKPQNNAYLGFVKNTPMMRLGKVMGGSSTINGMVYTRGNKMDYDSWARLGNTGWDYDSVLPYFKKSERYNDNRIPLDDPYHGRDGLLKVEMKKVSNVLIEQFLRAGHSMGYRVADPNGEEQIGFWPAFRTIGDGVRASAAESFLAPVVDRPNLQIRTNARVKRVIFNKRKQAVGVEYTLDGKLRRVRALKEVILSAGVINSPQLLLLSGVGPKKHLREKRVQVVADVAGVGQNLQTHPNFPVAFTVKAGSVLTQEEVFNLATFKEYITSQTGPIATGASTDAYAWLNLADPLQPSWSDVMLEISSTHIVSAGAEFLAPIANLNVSMLGEVAEVPSDASLFVMATALVRPKSRGTVSLRSANHLDTPVIDVRTLSHPDDFNLLVKVIRKAIEIASTPAMREVLDVKYFETMAKPCRNLPPLTDQYWHCLVRHMVYVGYDFTSSAKMAPASDPLGVVSPRLRVRGVTGLRVIDSSVIPEIPSAPPMAATYMIAEKGADMIKEDWGYPTEPL